VIKLNNITPYTNIAADSAQAGRMVNKGDVEKAARQVEEVFLNEILKVMFQNTEFSKEKVVSDYLPVFTMEISKSISMNRGIGLQDFLIKSPSFNMSVEKGMGRKSDTALQDSGAALRAPDWSMNIRAYKEVLE
jgi:Rod binding domain-containing protein